MIEITTRCAECGAEFAPDHADYVRGIWHTCRRCRGKAHPPVFGDLKADTGAALEHAARQNAPEDAAP